MVGTTLSDIRTRIENFADDDGDYYLVCARTGDRPVPAETLRFGSRATGRAAARATEQYRATLRRYDPRLPFYDLVVCEVAEWPDRPSSTEADAQDDWGRSTPSPPANRRKLAELCHRVAAAVFETLSIRGHDDVEHTIMDAYFDHAETVTDPDLLCLRLLESMAAALDDHLPPATQATVVAGAATRLTDAESPDEPMESALESLQKRGLLGEYSCKPRSIDREKRTGSIAVELADYALSSRDDKLPVLPLVVELYRHQPQWPPTRLDARPVDGGWQLTVELGTTTEASGLVRAPVQPET